MSKNRNIKIITIIALMFSIVGLTLGFAAFSNVLTISSSATVTPDASTFSVLFSSSGASQATDEITPTVTGGATGGNATISGTKISGLSASFTEPGQTVTYTFWAHNVGEYIAYLHNITFGAENTCSAASGTTDSLVTTACDDITMAVSVAGSSSTTQSTSVVNHSLQVGLYEQVVVTITYASGGDRADGEFSVTLGDITLTYSSVDNSVEMISFSIGSNQFVAETGMTWDEFIASEYNDGSVQNDGYISLYGCPLCESVSGDTVIEPIQYTQCP